MLSICITVKNRYHIEHEGKVLNLFVRCLSSIAEACQSHNEVEVVITQ